MGFLRNNPYIAGGVALLVLLVGAYIAVLRGTVDDLRTDLADERAAHQQTVTNYTNAAHAAHVAHAAQVAQIENEWEGNARAVEANYSDRLAVANADLLRWKTRPAASSTSSGHDPATTTSAGPSDEGGVSIMDDDLRICTENTVKLIGWNEFYDALRQQD